MIKSDTKMFKNIFLDKKPGCGCQGVKKDIVQQSGHSHTDWHLYLNVTNTTHWINADLHILRVVLSTLQRKYQWQVWESAALNNY